MADAQDYDRRADKPWTRLTAADKVSGAALPEPWPEQPEHDVANSIPWVPQVPWLSRNKHPPDIPSQHTCGFFSHSQGLFVCLKHKSFTRRFLHAWKPGEGRNPKPLEERSWWQPCYLFVGFGLATLCCQLRALARLSRAVGQEHVPEWLCQDRTGLSVKMPASQFGKGTSIPPKPGHFSLVCYNRGLCSGYLPQSILRTELKSHETCRWKKRHIWYWWHCPLTAGTDIKWCLVLTLRAEGLNCWKILAVKCWGS